MTRPRLHWSASFIQSTQLHGDLITHRGSAEHRIRACFESCPLVNTRLLIGYGWIRSSKLDHFIFVSLDVTGAGVGDCGDGLRGVSYHFHHRILVNKALQEKMLSLSFFPLLRFPLELSRLSFSFNPFAFSSNKSLFNLFSLDLPMYYFFFLALVFVTLSISIIVLEKIRLKAT